MTAITKLNDFAIYKAYFEAIAIANNDIAHVDDNDRHFYPIDIAEILDNFSHGNFNPNSLVLENFEVAIDAVNFSQINDKVRGAFYVIKESVTADDETAKTEALQFSLRVGRQIIAKMVQDKKTGKLPNFDLSKVNINKFGPIGDEWHFYRFDFEIAIPANTDYKYDDSKWS